MPGRHSERDLWSTQPVVYQVYLPSFTDANGDGIGDLQGVTARIPYLAGLGVDALWMTPHYPSPLEDGGYDVSDYRSVHEQYGDLTDFDELLKAAHQHGLRVLIDLVPNHTSDQHPWFQSALTGDTDAQRRYHFLPGKDGGPPNNWQSLFGGSAWTFVPSLNLYYLHLFAPAQPDLNWNHPGVHADFEDTIAFWLDRGVDGIRVDVAAGLYKDSLYRDNPGLYSPGLFGHGPEQIHTWDQPEVHEVYRRWRKMCDSYEHQPMLVGEVCLADPDATAAYCRPNELHSAFTLNLLKLGWDGAILAQELNKAWSSLQEVGAQPSWVLSNHDKSRIVTRYGAGRVGAQRARAAAVLLLGLPGAAYVYAGDELGLEDADVPDTCRKDPIFHRSEGARKGRDGVRVPIPWRHDEPNFGFSTSEAPFLPQPQSWKSLSQDVQNVDPQSTLVLYKRALRLRANSRLFGHAIDMTCEFQNEVLTVALTGQDGSAGRIVVNLGSQCTSVPVGTVVLSSGHVSTHDGQLAIDPDTAVWLLGS